MQQSGDVGCRANSHRDRSEPLSGECERCSWHTVQDSYPALVKAYQDHLRENHHNIWVRS